MFISLSRFDQTDESADILRYLLACGWLHRYLYHTDVQLGDFFLLFGEITNWHSFDLWFYSQFIFHKGYGPPRQLVNKNKKSGVKYLNDIKRDHERREGSRNVGPLFILSRFPCIKISDWSIRQRERGHRPIHRWRSRWRSR